jgi:hypothetical protein
MQILVNRSHLDFAAHIPGTDSMPLCRTQIKRSKWEMCDSAALQVHICKRCMHIHTKRRPELEREVG